MDTSSSDSIKKTDEVGACYHHHRENCRIFLFYSGAFVIELFWGLAWGLLRSYLQEKLHSSMSFVYGVFMCFPLGGIFFSLLFGFIASVQQSSKSQKKTGILTMSLSAIGLIVFLVLFSTVFLYGSSNLKEDMNWGIYLGAIGFFILLVAALNSYTSTFFAISVLFSNNSALARLALLLWSAFGQLVSITIVYFFPDLLDDLYQAFTSFLIVCLLVATFTTLCLTSVYSDWLSPKASEDRITYFYNDDRSLLDVLSEVNFCHSLHAKCIMSVWLFFLSAMLYSTQLAIVNWSTTFVDDFGDELPQDYIGGFKVSLAARFYQQIAILLSAVLFFLFEYYGLGYHFCSWVNAYFSQDSLMGSSRESSQSLQFYTNPHSVEILFIQVVSATFALATSMICLLSLRSAYLDPELTAMIGFAMTGLSSAALYGGREFQRSLARYWFNLKPRAFDEELAKQREFFDRLDTSIWFTMAVSFGQIIPILSAMFIDTGMPYLGLFKYVGGFVGFCWAFLIVSTGSLYCLKDEKNASPEVTADSNGTSTMNARMIRFRARFKHPKPSLKKMN
jgi:hypothetical protein